MLLTMFLLTGVLAAVSALAGHYKLQLDQARIQGVLDAKQADIDAHERAIVERGQQVAGEIAQIEQERVQVKTPEQARVALPKVLPIAEAPPVITRDHLPPAVALPLADVQPLYDFGAACQECKLKLAAADKDKQDLAAEIADLEAQRAAALKQGKLNFWQRVGRSLKVVACASTGAGVGSLGAGARGAVVGAAGAAVVCSIL